MSLPRSSTSATTVAARPRMLSLPWWTLDELPRLAGAQSYCCVRGLCSPRARRVIFSLPSQSRPVFANIGIGDRRATAALDWAGRAVNGDRDQRRAGPCGRDWAAAATGLGVCGWAASKAHTKGYWSTIRRRLERRFCRPGRNNEE